LALPRAAARPFPAQALLDARFGEAIQDLDD